MIVNSKIATPSADISRLTMAEGLSGCH